MDEKSPARIVTKTSNNIVVSDNAEPIGELYSKENAIGAFILGEIPFAFLSGICFLNERDRRNFKKSSSDLWFPEDLYKDYNGETPSEITINEIKSATETINVPVTDSDKKALGTVRKRDKLKAAAYYALEATEKWNYGSFISNMDGQLLAGIDDESESLKKEYSKVIPDSVSDRVFEVVDVDDINEHLFELITDALIELPYDAIIDKKMFNAMLESIIAKLPESHSANIRLAFDKIDKYVFEKTEMDPDKALDSLNGYSVLKAFMFFLDQQRNAEFLRNFCRKLTQEERRFAYIMFGILRGMKETDRAYKSKRYLEVRLEKICMDKYPGEDIISDIPSSDLTFIGENKPETVFDIEPQYKEWFDEGEALGTIMDKASKEQLERIYKLMKDSTIPAEGVYSLRNPIKITVSVGNDVRKEIVINNKNQARMIGPEITKIVAKEKEEFDSELFKNYLSDKKRFAKFYKKNVEQVQNICRNVEK